MKMQDITSKKTTRNIVPALHRALVTHKKLKLLSICFDIGGGKYDKATNFMLDYGIANFVYDPFNRDEVHNEKVLAKINYYNKQNDKEDLAALCSNVLCVIQNTEIRKDIIKLCSKLPIAYFSIYEGDKSGIGKSTRDGWQENRKIETYINEISEYFTNVKIQRFGNTKVIIASN